MNEFEPIRKGIIDLIEGWESKLLALSTEIITERRNSQNRTIKQIVGHMCDSASNNTHRTIHLQYRESPLDFPNYATNGNNDRWIAIQNYQNEDWFELVQFWKYSNLHIAHVFLQVDPSKLDNVWKYSDNKLITLREGIVDYLRHLELHLSEIDDLL